ncbi:diacylglycerol kinase [Alphaproteobacteria bacterium]|nr:diacylglycerol kinase [Alphaproteobacteria bacterium]
MKIFFNDLLAVKNAFFYSLSGLKYLIKERAFRQEIILFFIIFFILIFIKLSVFMMLYIFSSYVLILITEALNTALESVVNKVCPGFDEVAKKAKDVASAAVFIALAHFFIVLIVFCLF